MERPDDQQPGLFPDEDSAPLISKLERNIEKWPLFPLYRGKSQAGEDGAVTELRVDLDENHYWHVTHPTGLPGPIGNDLWVALCTLYNEARGPDDRTVRTSLRELADLLDMPKGGNTWALLWTTLQALEEVRIEHKNTFKKADGTYARTEVTRLFDGLAREERLTAPTAAARVFEVRFSEAVARHLDENTKMYRLLDLRRYRQLQAPTARRLYRYLDQRRFRGSTPLNEFTVPLKELRDRLPLAGEAPSEVKRTLDSAHEEMARNGMLESATYRKTGKGRSLEVWEVAYVLPPYVRPGEAPLPAGKEAKGPAAEAPRPAEPDAEYLRETVNEILGLLKDDHSTAFYVKVVKTLSEEQVRGLIGYVRESLHDGADIELARRVFTQTAKIRAKNAGLEL